jgi:peptidoglycan/xylan/chitin deacetylase (PgdA/CDA1 family)
VRRLLIALAVVALVAYGGYRVVRRTNALAAPAIVTPATDVHALLSPSLGARLDRLVHGNAAPAGPRPKLIALTFDDGPYPVDTPLLLDTLDDLHVHATFFLIGRDGELYPGLVRLIATRGNEIADHTLTHPDLDRLDDAAVRAEIDGGARALGALVADPALTREFRPPHGRYREATLRVAQAAGYDTILWNDDPGDWRAVGAETIAAHVLAHATAPEILLLHSGRPATVAALPGLVARFRAAGYRFVTVGELLRAVTPDQLNHPAKNPIP